MKSQNGWQASQSPEAIDIQSFPVAGTKIKLRCERHAGVILAAFAAEFHKLVEKIDEKSLDDWGYAYRNVRGSENDLSNHSSGTAIDLNSTKHPLGKEGTYTKAQIKILDELCTKYGIRGGYTYKTRKDDMHFEIIETKDQLINRIAAMGL